VTSREGSVGVGRPSEEVVTLRLGIAMPSDQVASE